jgi:hypothetical protein
VAARHGDSIRVGAGPLSSCKQSVDRVVARARSRQRGSPVPASALGLALVADHVARHDGTVHIETRPGVAARASSSNFRCRHHETRILELIAATTVSISGCGVGAQTTAHPIAGGDLPSALLSPSAPTVSSAVPQLPSSTIYLVEGDGLVSVRRPTARTASLAGLLTSLLAGPTRTESENGLSTAINTDPVLNHVAMHDGTATVDLGGAFGDVRGQQEVLAAAQDVLTTLSYPGVIRVQITLDGAVTDIPLADGTLTPDSLDRADYAPLLTTASADATPAAVMPSQ